MKTNEFIRKVKELGYEFEANDSRVIVFNDNERIIAIVYEHSVNIIDTYYSSGNIIPNELFDLCVEYAKTPIDERKEDKKYYLYNPVKRAYFNYYAKEEKYHWFSSYQTPQLQTQFTEEEIKNHKFSDIMELLEKEEVE